VIARPRPRFRDRVYPHGGPGPPPAAAAAYHRRRSSVRANRVRTESPPSRRAGSSGSCPKKGFRRPSQFKGRPALSSPRHGIRKAPSSRSRCRRAQFRMPGTAIATSMVLWRRTSRPQQTQVSLLGRPTAFGLRRRRWSDPAFAHEDQQNHATSIALQSIRIVSCGRRSPSASPCPGPAAARYAASDGHPHRRPERPIAKQRPPPSRSLDTRPAPPPPVDLAGRGSTHASGSPPPPIEEHAPRHPPGIFRSPRSPAKEGRIGPGQSSAVSCSRVRLDADRRPTNNIFQPRIVVAPSQQSVRRVTDRRRHPLRAPLFQPRKATASGLGGTVVT